MVNENKVCVCLAPCKSLLQEVMKINILKGWLLPNDSIGEGFETGMEMGTKRTMKGENNHPRIGPCFVLFQGTPGKHACLGWNALLNYYQGWLFVCFVICMTLEFQE